MALFLVLLLIFGVLLNSVNKVYKKKKGAEELLTRMEGEIQTLKDREQFLERSLSRLETDEGLKFEIRKKLNVAEVGESVAIIVDEEDSPTTQTPELSSWQKLKDLFKGLFR